MSDSAPSPRSVWSLTAVGLAGSLLVAYAAPRAVADPVVGWWYTPGAPSGRHHSVILVYIGMALLSGAWLWLGRALPSRRALTGDRSALDRCRWRWRPRCSAATSTATWPRA